MVMYDVISIGSGASGIFLALTLIEKDPHLKILVLDKGKTLSSRNRKKGADVVEGFGGAGSFSDGKLVMSIEREYGGNLQDYIHDLNLFQRLMNRVDETYMRFSDNKEIRVYGDADKDIEKIKMRAGRAGLHLLSARIRHLGTDNNYDILEKMFVYLKDKVDIRFETEACWVVPQEKGFKVGIKDLANNNEYQEESKYCVMAPGRRGMKFFKKIAKDLDLPLINNQVDIGVRVEMPNWVMKDLCDVVYEPKLVARTPKTDLRARTFCVNYGGEVVQEEVDGLVTCNGHSYHDDTKKTPNTNFALLVSTQFTQPFDDPFGYGQAVARQCNALGEGVIVQRLKDLKENRRSTPRRIVEMNIQPTLKEATPGNLGYALPYTQLQAILEMIELLDKLMPGIDGPDTLLYGPEIKWYSSRTELHSNLETLKYTNFYCAGDGVGITRGIVQAAMCGIIIAEDILNKENAG
ncbi:MAG: FAD-dependent oxidoreductase [Deltaproteobacteria bacterium]|nr:FAD-dependent oxidoreductase [Deltaproteobacteria bacterium]